MKEIVFIRESTANMGGIQWQIVRLAQELFYRGCFKPVLITTDKHSPFAQAFAASGFEVLIVPMSNTKILSAAGKILSILKDRGTAIIQTHLLRESLIGRIVRKKRPDIRHIFRAGVYPNDILNPHWKKRLCHFLDRISSHLVDCYVANGQYLANEIINSSKVNPEKVVVLLNGKNQIGSPDELCPEPDEPLPPRIAMVANFAKGKGHDCLIEALAILKKRNLIIETRLIGGELGGKISDCKKSAFEFDIANQVEFYGYSSDIAGTLAGIPVVVLPSDSEGVPNCIIEAMSLRKLVIVSDTGGVGEIIEHRKNGLLHKPKDPAGLAELLQYVFTHKAGDFEKMRTAGFEKWKKELTGEKMVDKLVEIYKKVGVL